MRYIEPVTISCLDHLTEGVEDEEALKATAHVRQPADTIDNFIHFLLPHSVMPASIVVGSIFLTSDHLFWVEQRPVGSSADLICSQIYTLQLVLDQVRTTDSKDAYQQQWARDPRIRLEERVFPIRSH